MSDRLDALVASFQPLVQTHVADVVVSTVRQLRLNELGGGVEWETLVLGGLLDGQGARSKSEAEARICHDLWVAHVEAVQ